jgi:hypothetical protein
MLLTDNFVLIANQATIVAKKVLQPRQPNVRQDTTVYQLLNLQLPL